MAARHSPAVAVADRVARDARTRALSFAALFFVVVWANAAGYRSTYPDLTSRQNLVSTFANNAAARILYGVGRELTTVGGYTAWRAGGLLALFAALFGIFATARAMRGDEESGRTELVLAGTLTRTRAFAASVAGITVTLCGLLAGTTIGALAGGLPFAGSCYFGFALATVAATYVGIGAITNQLAPTRRGALGLAAAVLGTDFAVRVIGDTTDHTGLHWFSPLGWAEELRVFSGTHAIVLLLPWTATVACLTLAAVLHVRRDVGGAYLESRESAAPRTGLLYSPTTLAFRLERIAITGWAGAIFAFAFVVGSVAKSVQKLELPQSVREQVRKLGGIDITSARGYIGLTFVIFVFAISLFVCSLLAAMHDDESTHRLETLFALPYGRARWLQGRAGLAFAAVALCALLAGVGAGLGTVVTGSQLSMLRALEAGLNVLPAEVLFLGGGLLLLALAPRIGVGLVYAAVIVAFVLDLFGALLSLPAWVLDLSPFHHVAPAPAKPIALVSALAMGAIGIGAGIAGGWVFRHRDLAGD